MINVNLIKKELLDNLDDPNQTSFDDAKILTLVNEAVGFIVQQQATVRMFHIQKEATITVVKDTVSYSLDDDTPFVGNPFRQPILIERTDNDSRQQGTIITLSSRNLRNNRWHEPIVYFTWSQGPKLNFATKNAPNEAMTLNLVYAPEIIRITLLTQVIVDVPSEHQNLLILRATVQGFGGEKNVDTFWFTQYKEALEQAINLWSDYRGDISEVLEVDGNN